MATKARVVLASCTAAAAAEHKHVVHCTNHLHHIARLVARAACKLSTMHADKRHCSVVGCSDSADSGAANAASATLAAMSA